MSKLDPFKLTIRKGDTIEHAGRRGVVVHAKDVDDIGVSWNLDNPTKPDIIFTQTAIKNLLGEKQRKE